MKDYTIIPAYTTPRNFGTTLPGEEPANLVLACFVFSDCEKNEIVAEGVE